VNRSKAFTLKELLVVIGVIVLTIIAVLGFIGRGGDSISRRAVCANNLSSISKAMGDYATAYDNWYPALYTTEKGQANVGAQVQEHDVDVWTGGKGNSCNMYVLVRLEMIGQGAFICPSTEHTVDPDAQPARDDDFRKYTNLSYSMHAQRGDHGSDRVSRPLTTSSPSGMALLADRTPLTGNDSWEKSGLGDWYYGAPAAKDGPEGGVDEFMNNSFNHDQKGQNVVFLNASSRFVETPKVGVNGDNIWSWDDSSEWGVVDQSSIGLRLRQAAPANDSDSLLFP
jgi:type II secretory pathway pseudopilin PulG